MQDTIHYGYYLTFPIIILKDGVKNIRKAITNVVEYCLYDRSERYAGQPKTDQLRFANDDLGVTFSNVQQAYENGEAIANSVSHKSPKTSIRKSIVFDFYKNEKTEFEIVTFIAFAALRSILQKKPYTRVTNDYMLGRMAGNAKKDELLPTWLRRYTSRYQLDKIKNELRLNWGLKLYGYHTRGFYISFTMDIESLVYRVELRRKKTREKQLADQTRAARQKALASIHGANTMRAVGYDASNTSANYQHL